MKSLFYFFSLAVMLSACPISPGGNFTEVSSFSRIGNFLGGDVDGLTLFNGPSPIGGGGNGQQAVPGAVGSSYRIPGILTLANGNIIATADDRKAVTSDSAHNIDIAVRISSDQGKNWGLVKYPFHFDDFTDTNILNGTIGNTSGFSMSASYIDAAVGQAANGNIIIIANAFAWKSGIFGEGEGQLRIPNWDNYISFGSKTYLRLRFTNNTGNRTTDSTYQYMVDPMGGSILKRDGTTPASGDPAFGYSIDKNWYVLSNGIKTESDQYVSGATINALSKETNPKKIKNKLLYYNSPFQVGNKNFLFISRSTDGGSSWSEPTPICHMIWEGVPFKSGNPSQQGFIMSPGKFITIQEGRYSRRIIAAVQAIGLFGGNEYAASIYSDDNGVTWKPGNNAVNMPSISGGGRFSETQLIETPDSQILAIGRSGNSKNRIPYAISTDGGATWGTPAYTTLPQNTGAGSMVGATGLRLWTYFGRPMIAITHATGGLPEAGGDRTGGMVSLGYLKKGIDGLWTPVFPGRGGDVDAPIQSNDPAFWTWFYPGSSASRYAYSCVTELSNGNIAILAEGKGYTGGTQTPGWLTYKELTLASE